MGTERAGDRRTDSSSSSRPVHPDPYLLAPASSTDIAFGGGGTTSTSGSTSTVTPATTFLLSTNRPDILTVNRRIQRPSLQ